MSKVISLDERRDSPTAPVWTKRPPRSISIRETWHTVSHSRSNMVLTVSTARMKRRSGFFWRA